MRDLRVKGVIEVSWIRSHTDCLDILAKNLPVKLYSKYSKSCCDDQDDQETSL
jgi:hypothetical protein